MGGGHSKFDQNNWFKANGKLTSSSDTIDSATPTSQYCVYWITKRPGRTKYVVNQRDFDVVDGQRNLMYSTCAVPGTLAYFDVLGPGLEDYKLRVTADLARRHWTVYRYGTPTFPGQVHDHDATLQLTQEHSPDGIRRFPSGHAPKLYKVCGITVSWSRYAAVAVMFGPPTATTLSASDHQRHEGEEVDHVIPHAPTDELDKESAAENANDSAEVPTKQEEPQLVTTEAANQDSITPTTSNTSPVKEQPAKEESTTAETTTNAPTPTTPTANATEYPSPIQPTKSLDMFLEMEGSNRGSNNRRRNESADGGSVTSTGSKSTKGSIKNSIHTVLAASSSLRATQQLPSWLFSKAKKASQHPTTGTGTSSSSSSSSTTSFLNSHNPMEGVLQMDRPLIQCQEIFTHLIGTHQTMLISKEQVVQMLKDDAAKEREAKQKRGIGGGGADHEENVEVSLQDAEELFTGLPHPAELQKEEEDDEAVEEATTDAAVSTTTTDATATDETLESTLATTIDAAALAEEPLPGTEENEEQPLVGYWIWENSLYTHKIKMHLAKNSDLALHVVLAVIVNQVRYERNAIALTI